MDMAAVEERMAPADDGLWMGVGQRGSGVPRSETGIGRYDVGGATDLDFARSL